MNAQHNPHLCFVSLTLAGKDADKFLQGQLTCDVKQLTTNFTPTAICNLKGRVQFGLWLQKHTDKFLLIISQDCADDLIAHIKKYGAFSKIELSDPVPVTPYVDAGSPSFCLTGSTSAKKFDIAWQQLSIAQGNSVITNTTAGLFQPQELRLHQRGGVHYDKGCYLGQEIVARLYFKAAPKAWLQRVTGAIASVNSPLIAGKQLVEGVTVVNYVLTNNTFEALVIASPQAIETSELTLLPLPEMLAAPVARQAT